MVNQTLKGGEKKMEQKQQMVFTETCKKCGKIVSSLSKGQVEFNFKAHLISCKKAK
ncbi:MAG: hypothetical protein AABX93_02155 [Nanoarchaeota archaeon]